MPLEILKTLEDRKNPLLERRELRFLVKQDNVTPKKEDVKKMVADLEKVEPKKVVIDHIYQKYGKQISEVWVKIYEKPPEKKKAAAPKEGGEAAKAPAKAAEKK